MENKKSFNNLLFFLFCLAFFFAPISLFVEQGASFIDFIPAFILFAVFTFFSKKRKLSFFKNGLFFIILFLFFLCLSCLSNGTLFDNARVVLTFALFIVFYFLFASIDYSEKNVKTFIICFSLFAILSSLLIVLSTVFKKPYAFSRYSFDIIGVIKNPNYIVTFILCPFAYFTYSIFFNKRIRFSFRMLLILCDILFLSAFICSGTRSCVLTAAVVLILCFLKAIFSLKHIFRSLAILVGTIVLIVLFVNIAPQFVPQETLNRIRIDALLQEENNIRAIMWKDTFTYFLSREPILGLGINGSGKYSNALYGYILHNIPLQIVIDSGFAGSLIMAAFLITLVVRVKRKRIYFFAVIFASLFVPLLFINGLYAVNFWFFIYITTFFVNNQDSLMGGKSFER